MNSDLYNMLRSPDMREFHNAVDALRGIPRDAAVQLLKDLCIDGNPEFRCRGLRGLFKFEPHLSENVAIQMLSDIHPGVRWWAVYSLCILNARSGSRSAVPAIAQLLKTDPDELVRSYAAFTLGEIGDASVLSVLEEVAANDQGKNHEGVPNSETARKAIEKIRRRAGA